MTKKLTAMLSTALALVLALCVAAVAQTAGDIGDATDRLNGWWLLIGGAIPFVQALFVKANAERWFKVTVSLVLAVAAALLTMLPQIPDEMTTGAWVQWALAMIGVVQAVYLVADQLVERATGNDLNQAIRPDSGIGPARP